MGYKKKYRKLVELVRQEIAIKHVMANVDEGEEKTPTHAADAAILQSYLRAAEAA